MTEQTRTVALVTGAGRRIGRAIAEDLGAHGFAIAVHANSSSDDAEETVRRIRATGGEAEVFLADLSDTSGPDQLMDAVAQKFGAPQLVINNASIFEPDTAEAFDPLLFDAHMAIHVKAPVLLTAAMARMLSDDAEGLVVNMIDQRVWKLSPGFFSYTLSKSALLTATQTLAMAHAPKIRVNAIGPGPALASVRQAPEDFQKQAQSVLLQRGPELGEFGATIRYLWSARSVTGQMIALDGGQHLAWETPDVANMTE